MSDISTRSTALVLHDTIEQLSRLGLMGEPQTRARGAIWAVLDIVATTLGFVWSLVWPVLLSLCIFRLAGIA